MKKAAIIVLVVFTLTLFLMSFLLAERKDDIQAVKKAVKNNPEYKAGTEVKWFKVLVTDTRTKKDKVRITLPISLVDIFIKFSPDKNLRVNCDDYDIDLKELFAEIKKLGPMVLIEVYEDDKVVKIWLE